MVQPIARPRTLTTGRTRLRVDWRGRLVLQLQEKTEWLEPPHEVLVRSTSERWRDATVEDITVMGGFLTDLAHTRSATP